MQIVSFSNACTCGTRSQSRLGIPPRGSQAIMWSLEYLSSAPIMAKELKKRKAFCVSSATGEYDLFHAPFSFAREGRSLRVHGSVKGAC